MKPAAHVQAAIRTVLHTAMRAEQSVWRRAKSNPLLRKLLYDLSNTDEFSDLYEHEKMLADAVRVNSYAEAIRRHIRPGSVVVDLGTGTGILALMAARQAAKVYAIDHSRFISVAERAAQHNGVKGIEFVRANSREFICPEPVDIILHEQIGDEMRAWWRTCST